MGSAMAIDWDAIETALGVQVDTGARSPDLAVAYRADPGRYTEINARVMAPRRAAREARRRELQSEAEARRLEADAVAVQASIRQAEAIKRLVDQRLAELSDAPE
jgi:hypothetical protein